MTVDTTLHELIQSEQCNLLLCVRSAQQLSSHAQKHFHADNLTYLYIQDRIQYSIVYNRIYM